MPFADLRTRILAAGVFAALALYPQAVPTVDTRAAEPQGIAPRSAPTDYHAHAQVGAVTIGAEFAGHYVPMPEGTLTTEDFVIVETCLYGASGARLVLSPTDFSLRVNGKKTSLPSQPYGMVTASLKDPNWEPTSQFTQQSKTVLNNGDEDQKDPKATPTPVHYPVAVQRAMALRVQKASLSEGNRVLPQAGLLFFPYRHKDKDIRSVELIYKGPAGEVALALEP